MPLFQGVGYKARNFLRRGNSVEWGSLLVNREFGGPSRWMLVSRERASRLPGSIPKITRHFD